MALWVLSQLTFDNWGGSGQHSQAFIWLQLDLPVPKTNSFEMIIAMPNYEMKLLHYKHLLLQKLTLIILKMTKAGAARPTSANIQANILDSLLTWTTPSQKHNWTERDWLLWAEANLRLPQSLYIECIRLKCQQCNHNT